MDKKVIKFMFEQLKPYKVRVVVISLCMVVVALLGILYPLLQRVIFDDGIIKGNLNVVIKYTLFFLGLFIVEQIFSFVQFVHYEHINRQIPYNLMYKAVEHSINLKVSYHKDNNFTKTVSNVYSDITQITQIINNSLLQTLVNFFKIVGGIIGLGLIDWRLTIFILAIVPLEILTKNLISSRRRKYFAEHMKLNEKFSMWFGENLKNIEIIKLWNLQNRRMNEYKELKKEILKAERKMEYSDHYSNLSSNTLLTLFTHGLNLLGAVLIFGGDLTIGGLFAFTAYYMYVMQPIALLANMAYMLNSSIPAFKRYMEYLENDTENLDGIGIADTCHEIKVISFDNVVLGYDNKESVLKSISFTINKGEKVAFVGVNGSGKSSIINLLLRFFEPTKGVIRLNGIDIQSIALNDYRELFCVMNQSQSLFDDSIRNNINILGDLSEEQIRYYLDLATASDFVELLPNGFDTSVGYNGSKLSGGERQKISLARTLAKNGKILILDEATASFDIGAEKKFDQYLIQSNLYDIVIVISHREDILRGLDKIFMVDDGVIVDYGSFEKLEEESISFKKILTHEKEREL